MDNNCYNNWGVWFSAGVLYTKPSSVLFQICIFYQVVLTNCELAAIAILACFDHEAHVLITFAMHAWGSFYKPDL